MSKVAPKWLRKRRQRIAALERFPARYITGIHYEANMRAFDEFSKRPLLITGGL